MEPRISLSQCLLISTLAQLSAGVFQINNKKPDLSWVEIDEWSPCTVTCGIGTQQKAFACVKRGTYSESIESNDICKSLQTPNPIIRNCNFGNCTKVYFWKPSSWGPCSQTCGNAGRRTREIDCLYNEGEHVMELSSDEYCDQPLRPQASSSCNLLDCPAVFVTGNWGRCTKIRDCFPGRQSRSLDCVVLLKTGERKKVTKSACYNRFLPPPSWKICLDHVNTKSCLKSNERLPEIETKNDTFIQMRRTKKLKLQIGQVAYVLLFSKIVLRCPVNYFVAKDIIWKHKLSIYNYTKNKKIRIRVDERGRLRIGKFNTGDQGVWTCIAGATNASSILKYRNPSLGYYDWILRSTLWNKEMLNEAPQNRVSKNEVVQWIIGSWSACSVTCAGQGIQTRDVHCEEIDTRHYNIIDDNICENHKQNKPHSKRSCLRSSLCPKWILKNHDMTKCSNECLRIGVAKVEGKLICSFQEKEVEATSCSKEEMPEIGCSNEKCQVMWKLSKWSKCSLSCGGVGIVARYVACVWKNTGKPAGSLCYYQHLSIPKVIKACITPRCNLKCIDLFDNCKGQEKLCKLSIYTYMCCSTCQKVYLKFRGQYAEEKSVNRNYGNNQAVKKMTNDNSAKIATMTMIPTDMPSLGLEPDFGNRTFFNNTT